jgi:hypothetical protein
MLDGQVLGRLIELAFDYVLAETEQQANQAYAQAKMLIPETRFNTWLDLTENIRVWNSNNGNNYPMSWVSALKFLSTDEVELNLSQTEDQ